MKSDYLERIASSLEKSNESDLISNIVATLPSAFLASVAAIVAAWATSHFSNRYAFKNAISGVLLEINAIKNEIDRCLSITNSNQYIECEVVNLRSDVIPIFKNNAHFVSRLTKENSERIFRFYTSFLTLPSDLAGRKFAKNDLLALSNIAKQCLGER
jgi:hypothetical protein